MADHAKPGPGEAAPFYMRYIDAAPWATLDAALEGSWRDFERLLCGIGPDREGRAYAPGKWTIRQLVQHVLDTERVMAYRALCFARNDATALPSFAEDDWAREADGGHRRLRELIAEGRTVREATRHLFRSLTEAQGLRIGTANGSPMSARGAGWVIAGHMMHHARILNERYLIDACP
ncbi:MAG: DinB family protein [Flavobacteriales bacterium]